jgi:2-methylisocitrate lyase-like PEP mutase family enzyme
MNHISQKEKAERFRELHHSGKMLVLPNIWDPLGAILLESLEYPAVATASASVAFANGYNDGEIIPFYELLALLKKIVGNVNVPVTADIESGYADNDFQLRENIELLIDTGLVGINIEDTDKKTNELQSIETQCNKIRLIKKVSGEMGIPIFINARIKRVIAQVKLPLNMLTIPGIPDLKSLSNLGVARVSLGPSFLKIAVRSMKELATALKDYEGLQAITGNEITSDYLKSLVNKTY